MVVWLIVTKDIMIFMINLWCFDLNTKLWQEIEIEDKNGSVVSCKERKYYLFTRYEQYAIIFGGSDACYCQRSDFNCLIWNVIIFLTVVKYVVIAMQSQFVNDNNLYIQTSTDYILLN